jgi:hypothetical protein
MTNQAKRKTSVLTRIGLTDKVVSTANVFHAPYRERSEQEIERQRTPLVNKQYFCEPYDSGSHVLINILYPGGLIRPPSEGTNWSESYPRE